MEIVERIRKLPDVTIESNGFGRTFLIKQNNHLLYVIKKLPFDPDNSFIALPFDDIEFLNNNEKFVENNARYEIIRTRQDAVPVEPEQVVQAAISVYRNNDKILFLRDMPFKKWDYFVDVTKWTDLLLHYPAEELFPIIHQWEDYFSTVPFENCNRGWFHMDFYHHNVLTDDRMKYIVDFDMACQSYSALNIAQAFYIETFQRWMRGDEGWNRDRVLSIYHLIVPNLKQFDLICFKDMVKLMGFYWQIRTIPINYQDCRIARLLQWTSVMDQIDSF